MANSVKLAERNKGKYRRRYDGNTSPVSAVPPIVQVQDNTTFSYQVSATDANGDNLTYRWGTYK